MYNSYTKYKKNLVPEYSEAFGKVEDYVQSKIIDSLRQDEILNAADRSGSKRAERAVREDTVVVGGVHRVVSRIRAFRDIADSDSDADQRAEVQRSLELDRLDGTDNRQLSGIECACLKADAA